MTMARADRSADAAIEAAHIAAARALTDGTDLGAMSQLITDRPWLTFSRRWRTRRMLAGRLLLVYRVALEDATGVDAASQLMAVCCEFRDAHRALPSRTIGQAVHDLEPRIHRAIEESATARQAAARGSLTAFARARADRLRLILEQSASADSHAFQPGLFDRRAERAAARRTWQTADEALLERLSGALNAGTLSPRQPRLLLVLAP